ncbi:MAG: peptide chain release factor-like protein, partial [Planctomycetota bacterium]|nr:peptide chain release factor-like protein [Planctomycetota bacterium]
MPQHSTPSIHPACLDPAELGRQVDVTFTRRSGPGGQHRNKVETAVVLVHRPTGISAQAAERRSQAQNRAVALHRLRVRLAVEIRSVVE